MRKPWDKLRNNPSKQPIQMGTFVCDDGTEVKWHPALDADDKFCADVWVDGKCLAGEGETTTPTDLRQLGEFLVELADQLEQS